MKIAKLQSPSISYVLCLMVGLLLFLPLSASALTVTYIDPGYTASAFHTIGTGSRAMEFDSSGNLYVANRADDYSGTNKIYRLDAASGFATSSVYTSYTTTASFITGFHFASSGDLLISNSMYGGNAGSIDLVQAGTLTQSTIKDLPDFRPTAFSADTAGNFYITGQRWSDSGFGNIYKINASDGAVSILVNNFVGKGIAVDADGNIFASNRDDNNVWRFAAGTLDASIFASFDLSPDELTFDESGNLYGLGHVTPVSGTSDIVRFSSNAVSVPEPSTLLLLGSGLLGLGYIRRRFKA